MIVASYFDDDWAEGVAWRQHDVYYDALRIIVGTCQNFARFARSLLKDEDHDPWGYVETYDHRTLQDAHDLLAAVWRFQNAIRQARLPFTEGDGAPDIEQHWLNWLRGEVQSWIESPALVRRVLIILSNRHQPDGYIAESERALALFHRFPSVPWSRNHMKVLKQHRRQIENKE